ncbi:MAG: SGNH hydrolase domain-containing protein [Propionivibrio sp.]
MGEIGGALGLVLIALACLLFEQSTPFPGRYALAPTLGAALVILFAAPENYAGRLLGSKPAVGIGLISYSAYLWHQPIFAFARVASQAKPSTLLFAGLSLLSLTLAYLSWRFVERPFRDRRLYGRRRIFTLSVAGIAVFSTVSVLGYQYKGLPSRFPRGDADLMVSFEERGNYVRSRYQSYREAGPFNTNGGFKLLIVGDSFSQDLVNILHEGQLLQDAQVRIRYVPARCQIYQGDAPISDFVDPSSVKLCSKDYYTGLREMIADADAVFVAASWREWSAERLPVTLERLGITSKSDYVVFGRKSLGYINRTAYTRQSSSEKSKYLNPVSDSSFNINRTLAQTVGASHFVDVQALLCGLSTAQCPVFDAHGALLSHDGAHLTQAGARFLGERLANDPVLERILAVSNR